jgi:alpha-tubulin suppressor-like RCC1 family protein
MSSSFNFNRDSKNKISKKKIQFATTPKINNNLFTLNNNSLNLSVLTLDGSTVTTNGTQLNYINNVTNGIGAANKVLIPNSTLDISSINTLECDALIVNGNNISITNSNTSSESNSPYLQKIDAGYVQNKKALIVDSNKNIKTINKLGVEQLITNENKIVNTSNKFTKRKIHPITWDINSTTFSNNLSAICWSDELGLGVVLSSSGSNSRIMTSTNGTTWTPQSCPANNWTSICWSPQLSLFVAVANGGDGDMRMISSDGINWTKPESPYVTLVGCCDNATFLKYSNNEILAAGKNDYGQLNNGNTTNINAYTKINISNVSKIAGGDRHTLFLLNNGTIQSIGANDYGQLGNGTTTNSSTIVSISGINNAVEVATGDVFSMALLSDGTIKTWGYNSNGMTGTGVAGGNVLTPVTVQNISTAIKISSQYRAAFALLSNGIIKAWGSNSNGELGDGTTTQRNSPVSVLNITNAIAISSGYSHTIALLADGTVKAWGYNTYGQLGTGNNTNSTSPVTVSNLSNVIAIASGSHHCIALLSDGTIKTWGYNAQGQLGDGTTVNKNAPVSISGINNVTSVFAKGNYTYLILSNNIVKEFGQNNYGQLGNNTMINQTTPLDIWSIKTNTSLWSSVVWAAEINLFVAVASGGNVKIMTSGDSINWIPNYSFSSNNWSSIAWSKELNMLAAVASSGTNRVITSQDGLTWAARGPVNNDWKSICWSVNFYMFIAVASTGSNNRITTSSDGITWTTRNSPFDNSWSSVCNSPELDLSVAISSDGTNRIMYTEDGTSWYLVPRSTINENLNSIIWVKSLQKFIMLAGNTLVYSNYITQTTNIMNTNNWYSLFNKVNSTYTITQTGSNPDVELQLNSSTTSMSLTAIWYDMRIQDNSNFTISFDIKLNGSADATSFNIGSTSTSTSTGFYGDGPNTPALSLIFQIYGTPGIYLTLNGNRVLTSSTNIVDNSWKSIQIIYTKGNTNTWVVNLNGSNLFTYSDASNAAWLLASGSYFGFGSRCGGLSHSAYVRKIIVDKSSSIPQTTTVLDSKIINTKTFSNTLDFYNSGKTYNALNSFHNLYCSTYIINQYNIDVNTSIWIKELNIYVIAGNSGLVATSGDGVNWNTYITPVTSNIQSIAWSSSLNLLVGVTSATTNNVITSSDCINWTVRTDTPQSFGNTWNGVSWSPQLSLFVAVGNATHATNRIMTSSNGINWTIRTPTNSNIWQDVCWSPELNMFVTVGSSNNSRLYSYDGITWNLQNSNIGSASSESFNSICWSPELTLFVAVANGDRVIVSKDGINWNYYTIANSSNWATVCWASRLSLFIAVGISGNSINTRFMTSKNGIDWKFTYIYPTCSLSTIAWSNELNNFVACGNNNVVSFNNAKYNELSLYNNNNLSYFNKYNVYNNNSLYNTWKSYTANTANELTSICYSTDLALFVAISSNTETDNKIIRSTDGVTWESVNAPVNNQWKSICWASEIDLFVAVSSSGSGNRVIISSNGIDWTIQNSASDNNWTSICWSPELNLLAAVSSSGSGDRVMTSPNGINWTSQNSAVDNDWSSICWSPELNLFVTVSTSGSNNQVMTSNNGTTWVIQTTPENNSWVSVCWSFYYNTFIAISSSGTNRIMKSSNGINWSTNNINYKPNYNVTNSMKSIYAGNSHGCAIFGNESIRMWGLNTSQQFGNIGTRIVVPTAINNINSSNGLWDNIKSIVTTASATIVLLNNGTIQTRGIQQLGINTPNNGNSHYGVVNVQNIFNATDISAGQNFVLALLSNGTIKSWGVNSNGQLGNDTTTTSLTPVDVLNVTNAISISSKVGGFHSLALLSNNTVMSWGLNTNGQLGDNSTTQRNSPILINNLINVIAISAGVNHSLALLSDGTIMAWGLNTSGQLGNGNNTQQNSPVPVLNVTNAVAISAGSDFSLALLSNGTIMAWGGNTYGQLGSGNNTNVSTPILISGLTNVNAISAGIDFSLALLSNSTVKSWGRNHQTQLGNNTQIDSNVPINVLFSSTSTTDVFNGVKINKLEDYSYKLNNWSSIIWANEPKIFIAIAKSGTNRLLLSNDGINWYNKPLNIQNNWNSICWADLLGKFIIVSSDSSNNILLSNVITMSLLSTLNANDRAQIGFYNDNLVIGGYSSVYKLTINGDSSNNMMRLTNNSSSTNCIDFIASTSSGQQLNIINNSSNKITNITNHNSTTGLSLNNIVIPVNSNDLNKLKVTPGTAISSKAILLDSNRSVTNINNITVNKLIVNNKIILTDSDNNNSYLSDITPGTVSPSKLMVLDSNKNISTLNKLNCNSLVLNNNIKINSSLNSTNINKTLKKFGNIATNFNYPSNLNYTGICWSPKLQMFVACGISWYDGNSYTGGTKSNFYINYSYDGINWFSAYTQKDVTYYNSITWSSEISKFVAISFNSLKVAYSSNGIDWDYIFLPNSFSYQYMSITSGNNLFVAVGQGGGSGNQIMTSPDGITWTLRNAPNGNYWSSITRGNNLFVAVSITGTGNRVMTSSDGITWTSRTTPADNNWTSVTWGNNLFVAVASTGIISNRVMTSPDGITWTARTAAFNYNWISVIWASQLNMFIAANNSSSENRIMTSTDGINWISQTTTGANIGYSCLCNSPDLNIIVGGANGSGIGNLYYYNKISTSTNGTSWILRDTNYDLGWYDLLYVGELKKYFAISNASLLSATKYNKQLATSINGIDWTYSYIDSNVNSYFKKICWSPQLNLLIVLHGSTTASTVLYKSTNGIAWTSVTIPSGIWTDVKWISSFNKFIAVSSGGTNRYMSSEDGNTWTASVLPTTLANYSIDYSSSLNLAIITTSSNPTKYYTSSNGNSWTEQSMISNGTAVATTAESNITWISQLNMFIYTWNTNATYFISYDGLTWISSIFKMPFDANFNLFASLKYITSKPVWINKFNKLYVLSYYRFFPRLLESSDGINWTGSYAMPGLHNAYSNLYYTNETSTLIAYGIDSARVPVQPFLVLNNFNETTQNYNLSAINKLKPIETSISNQSVSTWISRTSASDNNWTSICYSIDKNLFVAVSNSGTANRVMTSPDGITWTSRTSPSNNNWSSIVYSQELGLFVVVANLGTNRVMTSSDGITWTSRTPSSENDWNSICWSPELSLFAAVSSNGILSNLQAGGMTSNNSNGFITSASSILNTGWDAWNAFDNNTNSGWHSLDTTTQNAYSPSTGIYTGTVVTIDSMGTSHNGEWLQIQYPTVNLLTSFTITPRSGLESTRSPKSFVMLGSSDGSTWVLLYTNTNQTTWSNATPSSFEIANNQTNYMYYRIVTKQVTGNGGSGNTVQIMTMALNTISSTIATNRIMLSANGINWYSVNNPVNNTWKSICWSPELMLFVVVSNSGTNNRIMTSPDGITWTIQTNPVDNDWISICWSPELMLFAAVSNTGTGDRIMTSPDGITWTSQTNPVDNNWTSICWASEINLFIAISNTGTNDRIMTSNNGINWTTRDNLINNDWTSICWSSGYNKAVCVSNTGTGNRVLTSTIAMPYPKSSYFRSTNSFFINQTNGRVGLGTISPNYQLELSTDSAAKPSTSYWSVSSDSRLKNNIEDANLDLCYNNIKNLRLVKYIWKDELYYKSLNIISELESDISNLLPSNESRTQLGWIANEVEDIFPKSVSTVPAHGYDDCKTLDSDQIIASLYGTIQKLLLESETQNNKISVIKSEINILQELINQLNIV